MKKWFSQPLSENTKRNYAYWVKRFLESVEMTPKEFLGLVKSDPSGAKSKVFSFIGEEEPRPKVLRVKVAGKDEYEERKIHNPRGELSANTKRIAMNAIRNFLNFFKEEVGVIDLNTKGVSLKSRSVHQDYVPQEANEVSMLLEQAPINLRPAIALMAYSGMRASDIVRMRFKDVVDELRWNDKKGYYEPKKVPLAIKVPQRKTREPYVTFAGPKCSKILANHITALRRGLGRELKNEDELFACYSVGSSINTMIRRLIKDTVGKMQGSFRFRPYSLRKYFRRSVRHLGEITAEYLMGHNRGIKSLDTVYNGWNPENPHSVDELRQDFARVVPKLEAEAPIEFVEDEVQVLREEIKELRRMLFRTIPMATDDDIIDIRDMLMKREEKRMREADLEAQIKEHHEQEEYLKEHPEIREIKQKVIKEDDIEKYLEEGWRFIANINNGKVIVEKTG